MKAIKRVWNDIRKGNNIDFYLTVIVAVFLAAMDAFGIVFSQEQITTLTLGVLALMAYSLLGNRYRVDEILESQTTSPQTFYHDKYPDNWKDDIKNAKNLMCVGVTLSRTVRTNYSMFEEKLQQGHKIKFLLIDPLSDGLEISIRRNYAPQSYTQTKHLVEGTLNLLCSLKAIAPDQLEIRTIDFPIGFGAFAIDSESASGLLYIEHYPFKTYSGAMPKYWLRRDNGRCTNFLELKLRTCGNTVRSGKVQPKKHLLGNIHD